jgi:hypothetical protein
MGLERIKIIYPGTWGISKRESAERQFSKKKKKKAIHGPVT